MKDNFFPDFASKHSRAIIVFVILAVFTAVFYGNTLSNGYVHDDNGQVENNTYVHSLKYLPKIITGCIWESALGDCHKSSYYRPLQSLAYLLTYQISSDPWIFHLVNLFLFAIDLFLVFYFVKLLSENFIISFLAAFIFLIHPLNTETINWIATTPELLFLLFSLLASIFYYLYRKYGKPKKLFWVYLFFFLGILTKEPAVFTPFVFLALDIAYFNKKIKELFYLSNLKPYLVCVGLFLVYMAGRFWVLGGLGTDSGFGQTILQHAHTFINLFALYIEKLLWPNPLILFYTFNPSYEIFSIEFLTSLLVFILFCYLFYLSIKKNWRLVFVSLVWFFVFLFPSIFFTGGLGENLFAERHVFASTIGFAIIVAIILSWLWQKNRFLKACVIVFLGIIIIVSFKVVFERNKIWHDNLTIYLDTLKYSPDADPIIYNLALLYHNNNQDDLAIKEYNKIIIRGTWYQLDRVYNNLGNIYRQQKKYDQALAYLQKSIDKNPVNREAYNNMGVMYIDQGLALNALVNFCKATTLDPSFIPAKNNFNNLVQSLSKLTDKQLSNLYNGIIIEGAFKISENEKITLKSRDCSSDKQCLLIFTGASDKARLIMPFVVVGKTKKGEAVKPSSLYLIPQSNDIALYVDKSFENSYVYFLFPTCDGIYYRTEVPPPETENSVKK